MNKIILEFTIEIDGDCPDIQDAFLRKFGMYGVIASEEIDGTDNWAILIQECEVKLDD